jgi:hypothetical protein
MKSLENKAFSGGPSGARSRDLRIKRPSPEEREGFYFRDDADNVIVRDLRVNRASLGEMAVWGGE